MTKSSFMRFLAVVLSVLILGGAALWSYLTVTEEERNAMKVHLEEGKTQTVEFESLCLVPGESCEYKLSLDGGRADHYDVIFDFVELKEGTLKNFARARIECKGEALQDLLLAELLEKDKTVTIPIDFDKKKNTELTIVYYMPLEVGNEAQNAEALFELRLTASNE